MHIVVLFELWIAPFMLRLRPQGYAQHERKVARSREPFTLSPSTMLRTGSAQRSRRANEEYFSPYILLQYKRPYRAAGLLRSSQRGQAATEVVLSLSFFLLVMVLGINFGKAFLLQQRAVVAARYAAWHEARTEQPLTRRELQQAGYDGYQMRMASDSRADEEQAEGTGQPRGLGGIARTVGNAIGGALPETTRVSATISYRWQPLGRVLPEAHPAGTHTVSLNDWRHDPDEESPLMAGLRGSLGWVLRIIAF